MRSSPDANLKQAKTGISIKEIVRLTGYNRASSAEYCEVSGPMCSGCARARSNTTYNGWTRSGLRAVVTALTCGAASRCGVFEARCGLLRNGRHAIGAPRRPMLGAYSACRPQELSFA